MVQMVFCDLAHTFHKQVTTCFCFATVGNFDVSRGLLPETIVPENVFDFVLEDALRGFLSLGIFYFC